MRAVALALLLTSSIARGDERVVVRGSTPLFESARGRDPLPASKDEDEDERIVFRKVGALAGMYELESTDAEDCARGHSDVRVRLWVWEKDVSLVLVRAIDRVWRDGIAIHVDAGTPVDELGDGRYRVHADGIDPVLRLPRSAVGRSYSSARTKARKLGGRRDGAMWSLVGACGRYRVGLVQGDFIGVVDDGLVHEGARLASIFGRDTALGDDGHARLWRGAPLYWPSGERAGVVEAGLLEIGDLKTEERACFSYAIAPALTRLCVDKDQPRDVANAFEEATSGLGEEAMPHGPPAGY